MTVGESLNVDRLVNWKALSPRLGSPLRHSGLVQCPRCCWSNTEPAVYMTRRLPITNERTCGTHTSLPSSLGASWEQTANVSHGHENYTQVRTTPGFFFFFFFWIPAVNTSTRLKDSATNTEKDERDALRKRPTTSRRCDPTRYLSKRPHSLFSTAYNWLLLLFTPNAPVPIETGQYFWIIQSDIYTVLNNGGNTDGFSHFRSNMQLGWRTGADQKMWS